MTQQNNIHIEGTCVLGPSILEHEAAVRTRLQDVETVGSHRTTEIKHRDHATRKTQIFENIYQSGLDIDGQSWSGHSHPIINPRTSR